MVRGKKIVSIALAALSLSLILTKLLPPGINMADFLFIGAPTDVQTSSKSSTFKTLRDRTTALADVFELKVPETLKVGTQDSFLACVEELHKVDSMAEQVRRFFLLF